MKELRQVLSDIDDLLSYEKQDDILTWEEMQRSPLGAMMTFSDDDDIKFKKIFENHGRMRFLCTVCPGGKLHLHGHTFDELIEVLSGVMIEKVNNVIYTVGEKHMCPRGPKHLLANHSSTHELELLVDIYK